MEGLILTTPEQLQNYIAIAVRNEFSKFTPSAPATAAPTDELLTRQQAADVLKVSLPTLNLLTKSGKVPGHRIPGTNRLRYKASDVNNALTKIKPADLTA